MINRTTLKLPPTPTGRGTYLPNGKFQPGDIVSLVSGGPDMTVIGECLDCGAIEAAYADSDNNIIFEEFPAICLELAS